MKYIYKKTKAESRVHWSYVLFRLSFNYFCMIEYTVLKSAPAIFQIQELRKCEVFEECASILKNGIPISVLSSILMIFYNHAFENII